MTILIKYDDIIKLFQFLLYILYKLTLYRYLKR